MKKVISITPFMAAAKMRKWCAYQERSQQDALFKLNEMGIEKESAEHILSDLISDGFLNEERFAKALARGKFRIKGWGRIKIKVALRKHGVNDPCISSALKEINEEEYVAKLDQKIMELLRGRNLKDPMLKNSLLKSVFAKGFESDLAIERLNVLLKSKVNDEY